jgi:hypothetical protein
MKDAEIIRMAREAGFAHSWSEAAGEALERFAALVAASEREECAKICDGLHWEWHMGDNSGPKECATAIRARVETTPKEAT